MQAKRLLILLILTIQMLNAQDQVISSSDFQSNVITTNSFFFNNYMGLSLYQDELIPLISDSLLQSYILNSNIYQDWSANFNLNIHASQGHYFDCSVIQNNDTCDFDMVTNTTFLTQFGTFMWNTVPSYSLSLEYNPENSNFSDPSYLNKLSTFTTTAKAHAPSGQPYSVISGDQIDQYVAREIKTSYSIIEYYYDVVNLVTNVGNSFCFGPGLTQDADISYYQYLNAFTGLGLHIFTFRCIVFHDPTLATIENLISDNYTSGYLKRRFTLSNGSRLYQTFTSNPVGISDIRLVNNTNGIEGVTNSFAATIWLVQTAIEFALMGGLRFTMFSPLTTSKQSLIGPPPLYKPTSLYYGALLVSLFRYDNPSIELPRSIVAGTSSNIKMYGLKRLTRYHLIIINKDTNQNLNGVVKVKLISNKGIYCINVEAPSLSQTQDITFGGIKFISNTTTFQGNYSTTEYSQVNSQNQYEIKVKYAQIIYCTTSALTSDVSFPVKSGSGALSFEKFMGLFWMMILVTLAMIAL